MSKPSTSWQVEDTFFGAILGAILGTFIDKLPIQYVTIIIFYFVLFPMTLRKAEAVSRYALIIAVVFHTIWISLLVYDLDAQSIITIGNGLVFVVIFLGWLISLAIRTSYNSK